MELLRPLFGKTGAEFTITPDFHCDYGGNITLGEGFLRQLQPGDPGLRAGNLRG